MAGVFFTGGWVAEFVWHGAWPGLLRWIYAGRAMGPGYLVLAALAVPVGTFTGLWFWRLRPGRRGRSSVNAPRTEADLADMAGKIFARQQYWQAQVADAWEARERRLAAQVSSLIESAGAPAETTVLGLGKAKVADRREPGA